MRICNEKTRKETGFEHVIKSIDVLTPFGKQKKRQNSPFPPSREKELILELSRLESVFYSVRDDHEVIAAIRRIFAKVKDISLTIRRSNSSILTVVELFEVKSLLLQMKALEELLVSLPPLQKEFKLKSILPLLDALDPEGQRINTFYIYDCFSKTLAELRSNRGRLDTSIQIKQKEKKRQVESEYRISITSKFEYAISKYDRANFEKAMNIPDLLLSFEDHNAAVFALRADEETLYMQEEIEQLNAAIEAEELAVQKSLSETIAEFSHIILANCEIIGGLDFIVAKAIYALEHNCVKPLIKGEHTIEIADGRHLVVEEVLKEKGKEFCPVAITLETGVTCISGANMGGKTVTLKLIGLCALLAQHGYFIPASYAAIGLSSHIGLLTGNSQSLVRGLSGFGGEMEELKQLLDKSGKRALLLIDEPALGTNPTEGRALTRAFVNYLKDKPYISVITTHYDNVGSGGVVVNLQVRGLSGVDFNRLAQELICANRKGRIEIIAKHMDYRLFAIEKSKEVPRDAINIASMLGIYEEIIQSAKKYLEDQGHEE